eukprot:g1319.t1
MGKDVLSPPHACSSRQASIMGCVLSLVSTMIGGGVLSLPFAFSKLGVIVGTLALAVSALASDYSVNLLILASRKAGSTSYEQLGAKVYGKFGELTTSILLCLLTFLCTVAYLELVADLVSEVVYGVATKNTTHYIIHDIGDIWLRRMIMAGMVVCVLPLCFKTSLHRLKWASGASITSVSVLAVIVVQKAISSLLEFENRTSNSTTPTARNNTIPTTRNGSSVLLPIPSIVSPTMPNSNKILLNPFSTMSPNRTFQAPPQPNRVVILFNLNVQWWPQNFLDCFYALPIFAIAFLCHFNCLPTHCELRKPTRSRIQRVIHITMASTLVLYFVIGLSGYLFAISPTSKRFTVCDNILKNFSNNDPFLLAGRVSLSLALIFSFPLLILPCRKALHKVLLYCGLVSHSSIPGMNTYNPIDTENSVGNQQERIKKGPPSYYHNAVSGTVNGAVSGTVSGGPDVATTLDNCLSPSFDPDWDGENAKLYGIGNVDTPLLVDERGLHHGKAEIQTIDDINKSQGEKDLLSRGNNKQFYGSNWTNGCEDVIIDDDHSSVINSGDIAKAQKSENSKWVVRYLETIGIVIASLFLGAVVTSVVTVWTLMGSTVGFAISYWLPALFYRRIRKPNWGSFNGIMSFTLGVFSVAASIACTYTAVVYTPPTCV